MNCGNVEVIRVADRLTCGNIPALAQQFVGSLACAAVAVSSDLDHALRMGELLVAVMDRETGCKNIEVHEDGHGHGIFGDDDRYHGPFCALRLPNGKRAVMDPTMAAVYSATLLQTLLDHFKGAEKPALAAYNGGIGHVEDALLHGQDVDVCTTGKNYGADVLARAARFFPTPAGI